MSESRSKWKTRLVNQKSYTILYGVAGCAYSASFRYFNGTISAIEKRFKIPSRNTGIISVGNDVSQIFASLFLVYYGSKGDRPKWMSAALFGIALYCCMSALPHFLYGPGKDALELTEEFREQPGNMTNFLLDKEMRKMLCNVNSNLAPSCDTSEGEFIPQLIFFSAQFIFGIAEAIYYVFGVTYLDDNSKSTETPLMLSFSYFIKMIGPAVGFNLASVCLSLYISPGLTPTITSQDPRWIGCWWLGWLVLTSILALFGILMRAFPKELPMDVPEIELTERKPMNPVVDTTDNITSALKRVFTNKPLMLNNFATIFYFFGQIPHLMFGPKYIEIQFGQSPAQANFYSGTLTFIASAVGILASGLFITKVKPVARKLAAWNVFVAFFTVAALLAQYTLQCDVADGGGAFVVKQSDGCNCDYVKYSPVCGSDNLTYVSACHAGCMEKSVEGIFSGCTAVEYARQGGCPVNCRTAMMWFLAISCASAFLGASGITSNFLISLRCVDKRDKSLSIGTMFGLTGALAFIPAPIMYGVLLDQTCLFWGKTCESKGNCWLYDTQKMRLVTNVLGSVFVAVGALLDVGVWYYAKTIRIFNVGE